MLSAYLAAAAGFRDPGSPGGPWAFAISRVGEISNGINLLSFPTTAYGNGVFVSVSLNGSAAYTSNTANTWTVVNNAVQVGFLVNLNVMYANSVFVALGFQGSSAGAYASVSNDGQNWASYPVPTIGVSGNYQALLSATNNKFFVTNSYFYTDDELLVSNDGQNWTIGRLPFPVGSASPVVYANGSYYFYAQDANSTTWAFTSNDTSTWTTSSTNVTSVTAIIYAQNKFVALAFAGVTPNVVAVSTDGLNWTITTTQIPVGYGFGTPDIVYDGTYYIIGSIYYSTDGLTWRNQTIPVGVIPLDVYPPVWGAYGQNSVVYTLQENPEGVPKTTDFALVITKKPVTPPPPTLNNRLLMSDLTVDTVAKSPSIPYVRLRWSDTRGETWNDPTTQTLGNVGEDNVDVSFRRLGISRERVFEVSWSADVATNLTGAFVVCTVAKT